MTPEEKIKKLEEEKVALEKKASDLENEKTQLLEDIKTKDKVIDEKTQQAVGARKEYKKLAEMTAEEKEALSAKELELQERQEAHDAKVAQLEADQAERNAKEKEARVEKAIKAIAGNDEEYAKKLKDNLGRIKDYDEAMTEEEISKVVNDGANMIGEARPDPMNTVVNGEGGVAEQKGQEGAGFAETEEGKGLAGAMNLDIVEPQAQKTE